MRLLFATFLDCFQYMAEHSIFAGGKKWVRTFFCSGNVACRNIFRNVEIENNQDYKNTR